MAPLTGMCVGQSPEYRYLTPCFSGWGWSTWSSLQPETSFLPACLRVIAFSRGLDLSQSQNVGHLVLSHHRFISPASLLGPFVFSTVSLDSRGSRDCAVSLGTQLRRRPCLETMIARICRSAVGYSTTQLRFKTP